MKKIVSLLAAGFLGAALQVFAQPAVPPAAPPAAQPELRPVQVVMQARAAWMKSMSENLAAKKLADVAKDANDLSAQATKVAGGAAGEPKALHQKVADLAMAVSQAATKGDEATVKTKLGEIKDTCTECHTKFRPKK